MNSSATILKAVQALLGLSPAEGAVMQALEKILVHFDCSVGTLHRFDPASNLLVLVAHKGVPPFVLDKVQQVSVGKGMAGIAAERKTPVQVCNLQTDASGVVRPGAKLTEMQGSIAAPILEDGKLLGVVGIAKPVPYEFTAEEVETILRLGSLLAGAFTPRR